MACGAGVAVEAEEEGWASKWGTAPETHPVLCGHVTWHTSVYFWAARMERERLSFTMPIMRRPPVSRKVGQKREKRRAWGP